MDKDVDNMAPIAGGCCTASVVIVLLVVVARGTGRGSRRRTWGTDPNCVPSRSEQPASVRGAETEAGVAGPTDAGDGEGSSGERTAATQFFRSNVPQVCDRHPFHARLWYSLSFRIDEPGLWANWA